MQRVARLLLWIGFALTLLGLAGCSVGCLVTVVEFTEAIQGQEAWPEETGEIGVRPTVETVIGIVSIFLGLGMVIAGAVLKAVAPKARGKD